MKNLKPHNTAFHQFFNNKGSIAAIAEKAHRNLEIKCPTRNEDANPNAHRLHYFAIGHKFKSLNTVELFNLKYDENTVKYFTLFMFVELKYKCNFKNSILKSTNLK